MHLVARERSEILSESTLHNCEQLLSQTDSVTESFCQKYMERAMEKTRRVCALITL